jgi:erythronate-4-phosphate dehydrogenase
VNIVVNKHTPLAVEAFSPFGTVTALGSKEITREALAGADALIVRSETHVDRALLEDTPVRFVGTVTIGTDHVDTGWLHDRGIAFASAPGSNANSVAEYVTAALLVRSGRIGKPLQGATIGVVGVGNVGSRVARMARALGMEVLLNDPPLARATGDPMYRPLEELLDADIITLHVPLTTGGEDPTRRLFDAGRIGRMKPGSLLVNTARGPVVDNEALAAAIAGGRIGGAVLDVWDPEPDISVPLLDLVTLGTPHIAGYSLDGKLNAVRMIHDALSAFLGREPAWAPEPLFAPPEPLEPGTGGAGREAGLLEVVRQAYDIEQDDRTLRRIRLMTAAERPKYFSRLRADYRTRREFPHRILKGGREDIADTLRALGFAVKGGGAA